MTEFASGQIRHPLNLPDMILKCEGPIQTEKWDNSKKINEFEMFYLTMDFPPPHYVLIDRVLDNSIFPQHKFALVHLITHSDKYDNLKISEKFYDKSSIKIHFNKSYITRDTFLILLENIKMDKIYGFINMSELRKALEY